MGAPVVTQVARSVPFDNSTNYFGRTNTQEALEEVKGSNVVVVNPTGTGVIAAAIAAVTTATSTNQFFIQVQPGTYTEPQLVMKNFVSIVGMDTQSTIITPSDPTNHLVIGATATLRHVTIKGVTTAGKAGIYSTASGLQVRNCVIRDNPINILVEGVASLASLTAEDLIITGVFDTGIQVKNAGAGVSAVLKNSIFNAATANSSAKCAIAEGASVSIIFSSLIGSGASSIRCLTVQNGATLKVLGAELKSFNKAVWAENSGTGPVLDVLGINCDSNSTDVQIDHASATGAISGIITRSKVTNSAPNGVQLSYQDPVNGDFNVTRILATRGFATESTTYNSSAGEVQILSTDARNIIVTGSTAGSFFDMPDATSLRNGHEYLVINTASVFTTTRKFDNSGPIQVSPNFAAHWRLLDNSTSAGTWFVAISAITSSTFDPQISSLAIYDDFTNLISWSPSTTGSGSVASVSTGNATYASGKHQGVSELTLGNLLSASAALAQSAGLSTSTVFGNGAAEFQALVRIPTLATVTDDYVYRIGMGTSTSADHVNGIYFEYNRANSANWSGKTASASSRTTVTGSVAVAAGSWIHLRYLVNEAGTLVTFLVNNTVIGTIATNIPTTTGAGCGPNLQLTSVAFLGTTRSVFCDYFYFLKQFTARD